VQLYQTRVSEDLRLPQPSAAWYFLDLFAFSTGLPIIISAFLTRFLIRRLPVIG
jgi:hypothetical protein